MRELLRIARYEHIPGWAWVYFRTLDGYESILSVPNVDDLGCYAAFLKHCARLDRRRDNRKKKEQTK